MARRAVLVNSVAGGGAVLGGSWYPPLEELILLFPGCRALGNRWLGQRALQPFVGDSRAIGPYLWRRLAAWRCFLEPIRSTVSSQGISMIPQNLALFGERRHGSCFRSDPILYKPRAEL